MNYKETIGFDPDYKPGGEEDSRLREYINLKLAARGFPVVGDRDDFPFLKMGESLIANFQEKTRLLADHLCPTDHRIDNFLRGYLGEHLEGVFDDGDPLVPAGALVLERHGLSRILSIPAASDSFKSSIVSSYKVKQGVCHNPASDKRTTKGVFHVAADGLPVPADKLQVPRQTYARLLKQALNPPDSLLELPYTSGETERVHVFASILLRPVICPAVPGGDSHKSMEIRFFAPGNLVSNLDFVESIFGNAGDPNLPANDAGLDIEHWSGHTGGVILAPHLVGLKKKDLALPHRDDATERELKDGMYWENEDDIYNDGLPFKITCRDASGVMVTLIADNYYGYCKKEVKTQISYATNLYGHCEEEHAGGAVALPSFDLGEDFQLNAAIGRVDHSWKESTAMFAGLMDIQPEGYGIDNNFPDIIYIRAHSFIDLNKQRITWKNDDGSDQTLKLLPNHTYVLPSGYKVEMRRPRRKQRWRLVGTQAEGTFCHKPCTVSGGGKSEISKSLDDAMITGPVMVSNFADDMRQVGEIINRDYSDRYQNPRDPGKPSRKLLSSERSLGSVIRMFTHNSSYSNAYNEWIAGIPRHILDLVYMVKRFYKSSWGEDWKKRFSVDIINGQPGNELKYRNQKLSTQYLRVGFDESGNWRTFGLRKDFYPAFKLQREDDISASVTVPASALAGVHPHLDQPSYKFVRNCEYRLFQRPDDAVIRGYDRKTESDFSAYNLFFSNYEPIDRDTARTMLDDTIRFEQFSGPMRKTVRNFVAADSPDYFISSDQPRIVDGKPTENPRYLQNRPDLENPRAEYLAELGARFYRRIPLGQEVPAPVNSVLPGRRNNPPDPEAGIRPLAVFGPIHYQELPELFMDFIASLTGKSPSTTGAGSEGALTKGPFNALLPITDVNNALVSYLLTGYQVFSTAAGHIGHKYRVDHDISLVVPEVWSRMFIHEREPNALLEKGYLEPISDFEHEGKTILASRLGYRITEGFVGDYFGRVFSNPGTVFTEEMLRPELQSLDNFVDGINNIVETQRRVALNYFEDGSVGLACPPLKALIHIMAKGSYEGKTIDDPEIRNLFTRESLMASDWYQARIDKKVEVDTRLWKRHIESLEEFLTKANYTKEAARLEIQERLDRARVTLEKVESPEYRSSLNGTLGADPAIA